MHLVARLFAALALALAVASGVARAQDSAFVQIEALPTLAQAETRARAYAGAFPNVNGFRMGSGWYAIALGPYAPAEAVRELNALKAERLIPADSYIARPGAYSQQFWPLGADALTVTPLPDAPQDSATAEPPAAPAVAPEPVEREETLREARQNEALLSEAERKELQEALEWEGWYASTIDGLFGPGTRNAMADWQAAQGYEVTGVLTTRQRRELVEGYRAVFADLGLTEVRDTDAGIEMILPMGKVRYARTEAPFVQYDSSDEDGWRVLLISQTGNEATLFGLYDILQTLEIVPRDGPRERRTRDFTIEGRSADLASYSHARLEGGAVKGYVLVWRPGGDTRVLDRVRETMRRSFRPIPGVILPDTALSGDGSEQRIDLLAGLEIRRPERTRTGFFVDAGGSVLTTSEAVAQCGRVTLGNGTEAGIMAEDDALGLALLSPRESLAPMAVAEFQGRVPRLQSEIVVAGFSFGDALDLPVLTFGTLADIRGLDGETELQRLDVETLDGDAGGPVFDQTGSVVGLLRPREDGETRRLPGEVNFAVNVPAIVEFLGGAGLAPLASERASALAPEDIEALASAMTVRVNCWN